jgi:hypothetical protein
MSVAIPQFMKHLQFSGAAPPLILATSRHCKMSMEHWWDDNWHGKTESLENTLPQCHFARHNSLADYPRFHGNLSAAV